MLPKTSPQALDSSVHDTETVSKPNTDSNLMKWMVFGLAGLVLILSVLVALLLFK